MYEVSDTRYEVSATFPLRRKSPAVSRQGQINAPGVTLDKSLLFLARCWPLQSEVPVALAPVQMSATTSILICAGSEC